MNKTLFIHIGAHKTGTSAIQKFLSLNRENLKNNGYLYPHSGKRIAHHFVPHGLQDRTVIYENPKKLTERLVNEMKKSDQNTIILSSESFELLKKEETSRLKEIIPDKFLVKIIYYVRRQDEQLESRYNQRVKMQSLGFDKNFDEFLQSFSLNELDYYSHLLPWKETFGKENIIVRVYEKEQLPNGIFRDFLSAVGLDLDENFELPKRVVNPSLNWDLIEIIRLCNVHFKGDSAFHRYLLDELKQINMNDTGHPVNRSYLSPGDRHGIIDFFSKSNGKVAREYLGREDDRLFYAPLPDPEESWEPYEGLTAEKLVPIFTYMIYRIERKSKKHLRNLQKNKVHNNLNKKN